MMIQLYLSASLNVTRIAVVILLGFSHSFMEQASLPSLWRILPALAKNHMRLRVIAKSFDNRVRTHPSM